MKKLFIFSFGILMAATTFFLGFGAKYASAKPPLFTGMVHVAQTTVVHRLFHYNDDKIKTWNNHVSKEDDGTSYWFMYFGDSDEKASKSEDNLFAYRVNADNTVAYMYIMVKNVSKDPKKDIRLSNAHKVFDEMCLGIGMRPSEIEGLWLQLALYGSKTNYDFFADEKTFYQYCGSIDRNVYFNFKPIGNHTGIRLMLGVDDD